MRGVSITVLALALAIAGYYIASPYLALHVLKTAIHEGDAAALDARIDFPHLRENLKSQFNAVMLKETGSKLGDNPFGVLALGLASKLVDGIVDSFVTPAGLASLAEGNRPQAKLGEVAPIPPSSEADDELFADARLTRESLSRFSAWVPDNSGGEIRFVFRRQGLTWRLTSIFVPLDKSPGVEKSASTQRAEPGFVPSRSLPEGFISSNGGADVRSAPTQRAPVIHHLKFGHTVKLSVQRDEWQQVVVPDVFDPETGTARGWVLATDVTSHTGSD